jgi:hypothetical protein
MIESPVRGTGLQYNHMTIAPGEQTERRGKARSVRPVAWRQDLTGRFFYG